MNNVLVPAILKKNELEQAFAKELYSNKYFYYTGYAHSHELPKIELMDNKYQYAVVDSKDNVVGFFSYIVNPVTDTVNQFGLYAFGDGNPLVGLDARRKMEELVCMYRRIEWCVIGGNRAEKSYDKFCRRHWGHKTILHECVKDVYGVYHDCITYEILKDKGFTD